MEHKKIALKNCPWCSQNNLQKELDLKDYFLTFEEFQILKCDSCGLLFTNPKPTQDCIGAYYLSENYLSHQDTKKSFTATLFNAVKKRNTKSKYEVAVGNKSEGRHLDIGCGVVDFLFYTQEKGWDVSGIEVADSARKIAEEKIGKRILLPNQISEFEDQSFDLITMWHVLEHVDDLHSQVENLYRLLKPNGRLVIALPNFKSWDAQHYKNYWAAYDVPRHLYHFDRETITSIISTDSIRLEKVAPMKWDAFYVSLLSEQHKKSKFAYPKAFINGLRSNFKAKRTGEYSSLIYIFSKNI